MIKKHDNKEQTLSISYLEDSFSKILLSQLSKENLKNI